MAKILVIGIRPQHLHILQEQYSRHTIEGRTNNSGKHKVSCGDNYDMVIGMTKFMNHTQSRMIQKGSERYIAMTGGISSIKKLLDDGWDNHHFSAGR